MHYWYSSIDHLVPRNHLFSVSEMTCGDQFPAPPSANQKSRQSEERSKNKIKSKPNRAKLLKTDKQKIDKPKPPFAWCRPLSSRDIIAYHTGAPRQVRFLWESVGVSEDDLPRVLQAFPLLFAIPPSRMQDVVDFLSEELYINVKDTAKIIRYWNILSRRSILIYLLQYGTKYVRAYLPVKPLFFSLHCSPMGTRTVL